MHKGVLVPAVFLFLGIAAAGCGDNHNSAPSVPAGLSAVADNATCVTLDWDASTDAGYYVSRDDVGVAGYHVYRDNVLVGTVAAPGFSDNTLAPDTEYRFAVSSFDAEGGESARSPEVAARTKVAAWIRTFAEVGYAHSAVQAADNGFVVAGTEITTDLWYEMLVRKTDILGGDAWRTTFGEAGASTSDLLVSIAKTSDGGFVAVGRSAVPPGDGNVKLVKTDASGNRLWTRTFFPGGGEAYGESVRQTPDGGYIVCGRTCYSNLAYLLKADGDGNLVWTRTYSYLNWAYDPTTAADVAADNGYVFTYRIGVGKLVKTDPNGIVQWEKSYAGGSITNSFAVQRTSDNGYVVAGGRNSAGTGWDLWIARTDSSGNLLWERTFGGTGEEMGRSARQMPDGGFVIAGWSSSGGTGYDVYIVRTDSAGELLWEKRTGMAGDDKGYDVQVAADGGFLVTGYWLEPAGSPNPGNPHPIVLKTDSLGNTE